jgi:hypothetical protein
LGGISGFGVPRGSSLQHEASFGGICGLGRIGVPTTSFTGAWEKRKAVIDVNLSHNCVIKPVFKALTFAMWKFNHEPKLHYEQDIFLLDVGACLLGQLQKL